MRILHVNKFLYRRGGAESYMLDVAAEQRAAGHHVGFFSMEHPDNDEDPNGDLFPSRMELNPPPDGAAARARTAAQVLWRRDARKAMERVLDRERPDVVHLHNVYHQLSPSILRPLAQRGVPAVMTLHDYKLVCPTYQFLDADGKICEACLPATPGGRPRFEEATKRRCNGGSLAGSGLATLELTLHRSTDAYGPVRTFLCPSAFLRDKVAAGGMHPDRLAHLPNFCDVSGVVPATEPGAGVLFAGRLSHEKGVDTLVDAAALLPADVTVTIAGDGPERERLEKRAADRGLAAKVQFLGRVPMAELHDRMRAAAVVAVPSRWYENQPMSVLEAYGCGRPVVASDLGGLPEMVEDGVTGHLVPHDDPAALAEALGRLAGDPTTAHAMGEAARRRAVTTYSIGAHVAALEDHYRRVRT
ncbi:MAG: glycosyl transferase family 1 [Nocardioides sp.]|nr:glycosyl transferase family 1 [Nocardioides sp.]